MDRFTRYYSIALILIALLLLGFWLRAAWQPRVWELDRVLTSDAALSRYPYQFRVRAFRDGVATLSTPRSFEIPAVRFVPIIAPELANKDPDDPAMLAALQTLIDHQQRAQNLILGQPGVTAVDWELDIQWLADHGVVPGGGMR